MQMSRSVLFAFIEGHSDRYFYSKLVELECGEQPFFYQIVTAEELTEASGGKTALMGFFDYLKRCSSFIDDFQGKKTASVFFVDKDIDDFRRTIRRSPHIVYTRTYTIENYLFLYGNIIEAAAVASGLEESAVRSGITNAEQWCARAAAHWKEWVTVCLYCHIRTQHSRGIRYYGQRSSQINNGAYGDVDDSKISIVLNELQKNSGLSQKDFLRSFNRHRKKVNVIYTEGNQDKIFNGKWYCRFLIADIIRIAGGRRIHREKLVVRLHQALMQTLDFQDHWTEQFRTPLRYILTLV